MPQLRYQVSLDRDGGLPENVVVNVWHFDTDQSIADDADDIADRLIAFYQALSAQPWWAGSLAGTGHVKAYDMNQAKPRPPVYEDDFTIVPASTSLPAELAVCLSFQADPVAGVNQGRRRGRVYLGPFSEQATLGTGGTRADVLVNPELVAAITAAAADLAHGPDAGDGRLAVYSPTLDVTGTVADAFNDVTNGWVDNAWDIQRRRGGDATIRTTWTPS